MNQSISSLLPSGPRSIDSYLVRITNVSVSYRSLHSIGVLGFVLFGYFLFVVVVVVMKPPLSKSFLN